jgi:hypothetical protein
MREVDIFSFEGVVWEWEEKLDGLEIVSITC